MVRTTILVLLLTAACGGSSASDETDQQAIGIFVDVYSQLEMVQQDALAAQPFAPVVQTIDFVDPCPTSGTATLHGTYDGDGSSRANYTLDTTFAACVTTADTFDGAIQWTGSISGTDTVSTETETLNGEITYTGQTYAGVFAFHDLTITTTISSSSSTYSVTVSGTYTIGGTTYEIDSSTWASFFGG